MNALVLYNCFSSLHECHKHAPNAATYAGEMEQHEQPPPQKKNKTKQKQNKTNPAAANKHKRTACVLNLHGVVALLVGACVQASEKQAQQRGIWCESRFL